MKYIVIICLLLLCMPLSLAYNDAQTLTIQQDIQTGIQFQPTSSNYEVTTARLNLLLFATNDYRQEVLEKGYQSDQLQNNMLVYNWSRPRSDVDVDVRQVVRTTTGKKKVDRKISFPVQSVPPSVEQYVEFTDYIDSSDSISVLAQSLAVNESDLFLLQHKIATWVTKNIEYNLSTLTIEANQPASQVISQGYGVCDEVTNLFIAINRELGIPARFVSGMAYTNSNLFNYNWGNHGWAEVYFPNIGWVPYDITYQQFGWIDPSHVSLQKQVDGSYPAVQTNVRGYGHTSKITDISFNTTILASTNRTQPEMDVDVAFQQNSVAFGSHNTLIATVTNPKPYYYSGALALQNTQHMTILDPQQQHVVLSPFETKTVSWRIQTNKSLDPAFTYTFPVRVRDNHGFVSEGSFTVKKNSLHLTYEDLIFKSNTQSATIAVLCQNPGSIIQGSHATILCSAKNGPTNVCVAGTCKNVTSQASFVIPSASLGLHNIAVTFNNMQSYVSYRVIDTPKVSITNAEIFSRNNSKPVEVHFEIKRESQSVPKNMRVSVSNNFINQSWAIEVLPSTQEFSLNIPAELFALGENKITIAVHNNNNSLAHKNLTIKIRPNRIEQYLPNTLNFVSQRLYDRGIIRYRFELSAALLSITVGLLLYGISKLLR